MEGHPTKLKPFDVARMERDILEEVHYCREGVWSARDSKTILKRHGSDAYDRLNVVVEYLIDEGFLIPLYIPGEKTSTNLVRGITPKGLRRLQEIQHPVRTWLKANWFPMVVAVLATGVGIASIVSDWVRTP